MSIKVNKLFYSDVYYLVLSLKKLKINNKNCCYQLTVRQMHNYVFGIQCTVFTKEISPESIQIYIQCIWHIRICCLFSQNKCLKTTNHDHEKTIFQIHNLLLHSSLWQTNEFMCSTCLHFNMSAELKCENTCG